MTSDTRVTMHKGAAALVAIALLAVGAGAAYLVMRSDAGAMPSPAHRGALCVPQCEISTHIQPVASYLKLM